jgi:hypothetical protein
MSVFYTNKNDLLLISPLDFAQGDCQAERFTDGKPMLAIKLQRLASPKLREDIVGAWQPMEIEAICPFQT